MLLSWKNRNDIQIQKTRPVPIARSGRTTTTTAATIQAKHRVYLLMRIQRWAAVLAVVITPKERPRGLMTSRKSSSPLASPCPTNHSTRSTTPTTNWMERPTRNSCLLPQPARQRMAPSRPTTPRRLVTNHRTTSAKTIRGLSNLLLLIACCIIWGFLNRQKPGLHNPSKAIVWFGNL